MSDLCRNFIVFPDRSHDFAQLPPHHCGSYNCGEDVADGERRPYSVKLIEFRKNKQQGYKENYLAGEAEEN